MKFKIRTKLQELENKFNDINYQPTAIDDDLSDALGVLLGRAEGSLTVDSGDFARVARTVGKFLREEGFDLIIDSKTLQKGYINSPDAELYVLADFPVKAIDDFVPSKLKKISTTPAAALQIGTNKELASLSKLRNYDSQTSTVLNNLKKDNLNAGTAAANKLIYAPVKENQKVGIRLNLNSSIPENETGVAKLQTIHKNNYSGKALSYAPYVTITDVFFNVNQKGRLSVAAKKINPESKEAKSKFPIASVNGKYTNTINVLNQIDEDTVEIGFNPMGQHLFINLRTGQAVKNAEVATIIGDRVYAKGVTYYKKTEAPEPLNLSDGTKAPSDVRFAFRKGGGLVGKLQSRKVNV